MSSLRKRRKPKTIEQQPILKRNYDFLFFGLIGLFLTISYMIFETPNFIFYFSNFIAIGFTTHLVALSLLYFLFLSILFIGLGLREKKPKQRTLTQKQKLLLPIVFYLGIISLLVSFSMLNIALLNAYNYTRIESSKIYVEYYHIPLFVISCLYAFFLMRIGKNGLN